MKRFTLLLYGDPGVGKSVFCLGLPKPFFITSDGNYEFLEEFGAKPQNHKQVNTYAEFKELADSNFDGYDTLIIDLTEDFFKWCEKEFVIENRLNHISDLPWSQGYDRTRTDFFDTVCKYIAKEDKNIVFVSHGVTFGMKDKRGVEHTCYKPSDRIPDKLLNRIEGRLRFVLRCYSEDEIIDDEIITHRYLSFIPKATEYGIARGINVNKVPKDIALDPAIFLKTICYKTTDTVSEKVQTVVKEDLPIKEEPKKEPKKEETTANNSVVGLVEPTVSDKVDVVEPIAEAEPIVEETKAEVKEEVKAETVVPSKPMSEMTPAEKLAYLKAKLSKK